MENVPLVLIIQNIIYEIAQKYGISPAMVESIIRDYDQVLSANVHRIIWVSLN